jgi:hypothetical protein
MRRTKIVFVMITFALVSLSVVSSDAKAPGPEGRIVFMSGPAGEDPSRVFTVSPCPWARASGGHRTAPSWQQRPTLHTEAGPPR